MQYDLREADTLDIGFMLFYIFVKFLKIVIKKTPTHFSKLEIQVLLACCETVATGSGRNDITVLNALFFQPSTITVIAGHLSKIQLNNITHSCPYIQETTLAVEMYSPFFVFLCVSSSAVIHVSVAHPK